MAYEGRLQGPEVKGIKLDLKDRKIMSYLSNNSRISLTQLAKKVGLKRDTVNYRIKRLLENQIILRFVPIIDFDRLGYSIYHAFILLDESDKKRQQEFIKELRNHPNTLWILEYSDRWDLEFTVLAKNLQEFDELITEINSRYSDIVVEKNKYATIKTYGISNLPRTFYEEITILKEAPFSKELKNLKLDKKDLKILKELSDNARVSTYKIGDKIGLSPDAVNLRIKRMIRNRIIRKFTAIFDLSKLDYFWYTFAVQMKHVDSKTEKIIKELAATHPNIIRVAKTLGTWDLLFNIVAEKPGAFHKTVKEIKNKLAQTIISYQTWLAYKEHYYDSFPDILESKP
jgi:Lrp/AsnC family leucine-responsive transcriptional regulator